MHITVMNKRKLNVSTHFKYDPCQRGTMSTTKNAQFVRECFSSIYYFIDYFHFFASLKKKIKKEKH